MAGRGGSRPDDSGFVAALPPSRRGLGGELRALAPTLGRSIRVMSTSGRTRNEKNEGGWRRGRSLETGARRRGFGSRRVACRARSPSWRPLWSSSALGPSACRAGRIPCTSPARSVVVAALVHFQYAVGFYASAGARHLARGAPGYVLYWILFAFTLVFVPAFSAFELVATVTGLFWTPDESQASSRVGGGRRRRRRLEGAPSSRDDESSDGLLGSDGEVRRHVPARKRVPFAWRPRGGDSKVPSGDLEAPLMGGSRGGSGSGSSSRGRDGQRGGRRTAETRREGVQRGSGGDG